MSTGEEAIVNNRIKAVSNSADPSTFTGVPMLDEEEDTNDSINSDFLTENSSNFLQKRISFDEILAATPVGWVHWVLFLFCSSTWFFYAGDFAVISFIMHILTEEWKLTPLQSGSLGASIYVGMFCGAATGGILSDRFGRRTVFVLGFFFNVFFGVISSLAPEFWSFFVLRVLSGIGLGAAVPISFTWLMEFGEFEKRGTVSAGMHLFYAFGRFGCSAITWIILPRFGWRWLVFIVNFIGIFASLVGIFIPESPRWLYTQDRTSEALGILSRIRILNFHGPLNDKIERIVIPFQEIDSSVQNAKERRVPLQMSEITENSTESEVFLEKRQEVFVAEEESEIHQKMILKKRKRMLFGFDLILELFSDEYASSTLLLWSFWWLMAYGCQGFYYLTPQLFQQIYPSNPYFLMMIITSIGFFGYILALVLLEIAPRKIWLSITYFSMGFCLVLMTILPKSLLPFDEDLKTWVYVSYVALFASLASPLNGFGASALYTYTTEVYPTFCRSTGLGFCSSVHRLSSAVTPVIAQILFAGSYFLPFSTFGSALILCGILANFFAIETWRMKMKDK